MLELGLSGVVHGAACTLRLLHKVALELLQPASGRADRAAGARTHDVTSTTR